MVRVLLSSMIFFLLMIGIIACPSVATSQEGFVFSNMLFGANSPPIVYNQGVIQNTTMDGRIDLAARPAATSTAKPRTSAGNQPDNMVDTNAPMSNDCPPPCCEDSCCDSGCCDSCGVGCECCTGCDSGCGYLGYDCCDERDFFRRGKFYMRGWLDQGITFNAASPADRSNGPVGYNWRSNDYMMNQLYTVIGRDVCANGCRWDAGGRVDLLYGTDYRYTQAIGLETHRDGSPRWNDLTPGGQEAIYGLSLPQLYAEFAVPFARGATLKFGHFYSLIGYESPMAPQNFFYSHSYAKIYGDPETETGMLASVKMSPNLVFHGGFSRGWNMWESPYDTLSFIGGACWTSPDDRTSVGLAIDTGDLEEAKNRTIFSLVISRQLSCRWTYVFQYDFGSQQDAFRDQQGQMQKADWYGIDNYLFYTISKTLSAGLRVEWFCDEERYIVFDTEGNPALSGNDYCELTLGLNWQPNNRVIVRPELRWDWSDVKGSALFPFRPYDDFTASHQFLFATDIIIRF